MAGLGSALARRVAASRQGHWPSSFANTYKVAAPEPKRDVALREALPLSDPTHEQRWAAYIHHAAWALNLAGTLTNFSDEVLVSMPPCRRLICSGAPQLSSPTLPTARSLLRTPSSDNITDRAQHFTLLRGLRDALVHALIPALHMLSAAGLDAGEAPVLPRGVVRLAALRLSTRARALAGACPPPETCLRTPPTNTLRTGSKARPAFGTGPRAPGPAPEAGTQQAENPGVSGPSNAAGTGAPVEPGPACGSAADCLGAAGSAGDCFGAAASGEAALLVETRETFAEITAYQRALGEIRVLGTAMGAAAPPPSRDIVKCTRSAIVVARDGFHPSTVFDSPCAGFGLVVRCPDAAACEGDS